MQLEQKIKEAAEKFAALVQMQLERNERIKAEKEETRTTSDNVTVESSDMDGVELARKMGQEIAQGQAKVVNGLTNYM